MRALRTEPKPEFKMSWDQSSMSKVTKNNNETISTIKAAPKVKTKEGQARSHALNNPATLETGAVDKYVEGKEEDLRTIIFLIYIPRVLIYVGLRRPLVSSHTLVNTMDNNQAFNQSIQSIHFSSY